MTACFVHITIAVLLIRCDENLWILIIIGHTQERRLKSAFSSLAFQSLRPKLNNRFWQKSKVKPKCWNIPTF